jgi:hypothetical protein
MKLSEKYPVKYKNKRDRFDAEKIYNVIVANQDGGNGNRYFANLHKYKQASTNVGSCCESQGVRAWSSLPEYLYPKKQKQKQINKKKKNCCDLQRYSYSNSSLYVGI